MICTDDHFWRLGRPVSGQCELAGGLQQPMFGARLDQRLDSVILPSPPD